MRRTYKASLRRNVNLSMTFERTRVMTNRVETEEEREKRHEEEALRIYRWCRDALFAQSAVNILALNNKLNEVLRWLPDNPAREDCAIVRHLLYQMVYIAHGFKWESMSPKWYEDQKRLQKVVEVYEKVMEERGVEV